MEATAGRQKKSEVIFEGEVLETISFLAEILESIRWDKAMFKNATVIMGMRVQTLCQLLRREGFVPQHNISPVAHFLRAHVERADDRQIRLELERTAESLEAQLGDFN